MFFRSSSNFPLGLDISDLSLKLVQLNKRGDRITVQAINKIDIPKGLIEDGEIKNKEEVIKFINQLFSDSKFGKVTSTEIIACLPESKTFIKLIEVENSPNDLSELIKLEMEKNIPMAIEEIYYDWQIVKHLPDKKLILIGAAPQNIVNQYTTLIDEAGYSLAALEIESIAICRCLLKEESFKYTEDKKVNYGIIDIGAKRTSMAIYSTNTILFTVSMPISGEKITEKISKTLKIDLDQAEKAKIICGLDENKAQGIIKNIILETLQELTDKIKEAIRFYEYHYPDNGKLDKLIICGGGANVINIDNILKEALGLDVVFGNPLVNLTENEEEISQIFNETYNIDPDQLKNKKKLKEMPAVTQNSKLNFSTAIGLALRGIFVDEL